MSHIAERQVTIPTLKGKLLGAYEYLRGRGDEENARKVRQLAAKLVNGEFAIAFCGHFSAGKSTIINRLVGENLLPSSPIPTSANLVKVKTGAEYAKVFFKNGKPRLYPAPYDYELVKKYCKDGDQIQEIEISHADSRLPRQTVIMDTPGIDSADDAHRLATESAIHLADLIFYVMDYNHVQSELNFMFTKELAEAGKEVCLVINQVDKHAERELSFGAFQASVVESFAAWGVKPAQIFYTSLKKDDHAHNQFPQLQAFLAGRLEEKDGLLLQSIFHSLQKIIKDHLGAAEKKEELQLQPCREILGELSPQEREELVATHARLRAEESALGGGLAKAEGEFDAAVHKIMTNAYLMPFQTRALAEFYLASCQPGFKVGWLRTKQKTLAEREKRLELFYQDILEKTKSQLEWHLRDLLLQFSREKRVEPQELLAKIQGFQLHFPSALLADAVKEGARLSGDYVINYTEGVATEIKHRAYGALADLKAELLRALEERNAAAQARLGQEAAGLQRYLAALEQVEAYEAARRREQSELEGLLDGAGEAGEDRFGLFVPEEEECEVVAGQAASPRPAPKKASLPRQQPRRQEKKPAAAPPDLLKATATKLQQAARLVQGLPGFGKLAGELEEKAQRLAHKGFTVALFGAFSAGKSSFANALIGARVLPVSPNPTTAAINKIKPVNASCPHGTVRVKVKAAGAMLEDVNQALKIFSLQAADLDEALAQVAKVDRQGGQLGAAEKTSQGFLRAFARGHGAFCGRLGAVVETTLAEFEDYVALEEKSCFVEWIDLYYDCPLTRKGITLVDTPGADSINARHTGVAFDFIKNSDAILFVTYYNHAFSKADREFLIQLGRVKDSFQLDKMFFLINAIDLAADEEEKETVVAYVHEQLLKYGVRNPHLYPLSSLQALQEKQEKTAPALSGLAALEEAFYHFITEDLAQLAVAASENELGRVARLVAKLIDSAREDATVKRQKRAGLEAEQAALQALLARQNAQNLQQRLEQETQELTYYTKQRVFLRFNDFFKEAFNPAVLRDDGRDLKQALRQALEDLRGQLGFDFAQEMRAMTVRLDRFAEKITAAYQEALVETSRELNPDVSFSLFEGLEKAQLEFAPAFGDLPPGLFAKALGCFKNPKAFFEQNESKLMGEELQRVFGAAADEYLRQEQARVQALYGQILAGAVAQLLLNMTQQADGFYCSLLSALEGGVPVQQLLEIQQRLAAVAGRP